MPRAARFERTKRMKITPARDPKQQKNTKKYKIGNTKHHLALSCLFGVHAGARGTKVYQGSALNTIASFYIVSSKTDCEFKISTKNAPGGNIFRPNFEILGQMLDFESYIVKNSSKWSVSDFGSVKKQFFIAKSCLEHIPKLILIGRSMANCQKYWSRKSTLFQKWL